MNWRDENITDKQLQTIIKMQGILGWTVEIPDKRGPACDRIKELIKETETRIAVTGSMGHNSDFDINNDENAGDDDEIDGNNESFGFNDEFGLQDEF
jgi:hypothetical protein